MVLNQIFDFQTKNITAGTFILAVSYFLSAILGLFRDRLLAGRFGPGPELDVYFAAFRIPDFVYNILILGGLMVAFLPLFSEYLARDKKEAWEMTNCLLNSLFVFLLLISLIFFILTPWLVSFLFPGFDPLQEKLAIPLIRLLFLSPIFFGLSNLLSGILQYFNRFFIYSLTPILYNLGIIFGILFLAPKFGIFGVGMGVILGAFFHLAIQVLPAKNCGLSYQFILNFKHPALKRVFKLMFPRVFGVAAQQINLIFITALASIISAGSIAIFNFSNNFQSLPVGIIGASFAVVIFPTLTRYWTLSQKEKFLQNFNLVFRQILFLVIPISVLTYFFRFQIVRIILETGKFGSLDTKLTATCLGLFSISIFAQSLIPLLVRTFFSFQDTRTPTIISILAVALNIFLAILLVWIFSFPNLFSNFFRFFFDLNNVENIALIGLPLAFSLAAIFQFILLFIFLKEKFKKF